MLSKNGFITKGFILFDEVAHFKRDSFWGEGRQDFSVNFSSKVNRRQEKGGVSAF